MTTALSSRPRRRTTLPRSTRGWSRGIVWSLIGLAGFGAVYGSVARLDASVSASGKLRPVGGITTVSAPFNARITRLLVREGELVKAGQPLVEVDNRALREQLANLAATQQLWSDEVRVVGLQLGLRDLDAAPGKPRPQPRGARRPGPLAADTGDVALRQPAAHQERLRSEIQLRQQQGDLVALRGRLNINGNVGRRLQGLQRQGAIAQLELDRHNERHLELSAQYQRAEKEVEITRRRIHEGRLREQLVSANDTRELYPRYDRARTQVLELNNRLVELRERLRQGELRAPQTGRVFDLRVKPGETAVAGSPVLQIVPQLGLEAELAISNRDIGFLRPGQPVDVRITSLPFTDYGSLKGTLVRVGADAMPPGATNPQESFPAVVRLDVSALNRRGQRYDLRSGMAVTGLIQLGSRPVLALISDRLGGFAESTRSIR